MTSAFSKIFAQFHGLSSDRYRMTATLHGHDSPINTLAFNPLGTLLASGGDDENVRIRDMKRNALLQILADETLRWGQVTTIKFVAQGAVVNTVEWLYFGTGRGIFLVYRRPRKAGFVEHSSKRIFTPGDSVESFDVDKNCQRIVLSSHNGKVKLCSIDDGNLTELWQTDLLDVIPRSVRFVDGGKLIFIYGMETGVLICRDSETSVEKFTRTLPTPVGNVSVCPATGAVAIDNMKDGFDFYPPNRINATRTFPIESTRKFVKMSAFGEGGKILVCGRDHGAVYVYSLSNVAAPLQVLKHGPQPHMIQTVEVLTTQDHHIIASGASTGKYKINIWKKRTLDCKSKPEQFDTPSLINVLFLFLLAYLTMDKWLPLVGEHYNSVAAYAFRDASQKVQEEMTGQHRFTHSEGSAEHIMALDDAAIRKLFDGEEFLEIRRFLKEDSGSHERSEL